VILTQVLVFLVGVSSGILIRIGFERYDDRYRHPMRQFQELRKRIVSSLTLHTALFCSLCMIALVFSVTCRQEETVGQPHQVIFCLH